MNTLNEIEWYLSLDNPVGALLITGEWGCGKTYLINGFTEQEATKEKYNIVRVSLFAQNSVEDIHKKIKLLYFTGNKIDGDSKLAPIINLAKEKIPKLISHIPYIGEPLDKILESVLSVNYLDFLEIEKVANGKELLLIFDDFERSNLQVDDLLGVINEYVEGKRIKTIIIANENGINVKADTPEAKRSYKEIKEKVISSTVKHLPDYKSITTEIIHAYKGADNYNDFLVKYEDVIYSIFEMSGHDNIRSLKCAIQDFERIYKLIASSLLPDNMKKHILYNFLVLVFEHKAGNLDEHKDYGYLFMDSELSKKYSGYYSGYTIEASRNWLKTGNWIQENFETEIEVFIEKVKSDSPEDIVLSYSVIDVEDEIFNCGFPIVLDKAYKGLLNFDDYCSLLRILIQARSFGIKLPLEVNKSKIKKGVDTRIEKIKNNEISEPENHSFIYESELFTKKEKQIYDEIESFRHYTVYYRNKAIFEKALKEPNPKRIYDSLSLKCPNFDEDMALSVYGYYIKQDNRERNTFCIEFFKAWRAACHFSKEDILITINGLDKLRKLLLNDCSKENIKGAIDRKFIKNIDNAIQNYKEKPETYIVII